MSLKKQPNYRNRKLLDLARDMNCVNCGSFGTTVPAHSNLSEHGKGMGLKAHDSMVAWLCMGCHSEYDQGKEFTKEEKRDFILTMICRTYQKMFALGMLSVNKEAIIEHQAEDRGDDLVAKLEAYADQDDYVVTRSLLRMASKEITELRDALKELESYGGTD